MQNQTRCGFAKSNLVWIYMLSLNCTRLDFHMVNKSQKDFMQIHTWFEFVLNFNLPYVVK